MPYTIKEEFKKFISKLFSRTSTHTSTLPLGFRPNSEFVHSDAKDSKTDHNESRGVTVLIIGGTILFMAICLAMRTVDSDSVPTPAPPNGFCTPLPNVCTDSPTLFPTAQPTISPTNSPTLPPTDPTSSPTNSPTLAPTYSATTIVVELINGTGSGQGAYDLSNTTFSCGINYTFYRVQGIDASATVHPWNIAMDDSGNSSYVLDSNLLVNETAYYIFDCTTCFYRSWVGECVSHPAPSMYNDFTITGCNTHSPTSSPSSSPTASPTGGPTVSPTSSPTTSPTNAPSTAPTTAPTKAPSTAPTSLPTPVPSTSPTSSPTTYNGPYWVESETHQMGSCAEIVTPSGNNDTNGRCIQSKDWSTNYMNNCEVSWMSATTGNWTSFSPFQLEPAPFEIYDYINICLPGTSNPFNNPSTTPTGCDGFSGISGPFGSSPSANGVSNGTKPNGTIVSFYTDGSVVYEGFRFCII